MNKNMHEKGPFLAVERVTHVLRLGAENVDFQEKGVFLK